MYGGLFSDPGDLHSERNSMKPCFSASPSVLARYTLYIEKAVAGTIDYD